MSDKLSDIKTKISIPDYFSEVIVPQLGDYYSNYPVNFDAKPVACCPIHDEDTPSFRYYAETNTYYCFGCRSGGNIINLHLAYTEKQTGKRPSFAEAVDFLYEYFIKNNPNAKRIKVLTPLVKQEIKSTKAEQLRFSRFLYSVENQLLKEPHLPEMTKQKIYDAIDDIELLVDLQQVNAIEGMKLIKDMIHQSV